MGNKPSSISSSQAHNAPQYDGQSGNSLPKQYQQHLMFSSYFTSDPKYLIDLFLTLKTTIRDLENLLTYIQVIADSTKRHATNLLPPKNLPISVFKGSRYLTFEVASIIHSISQSHLHPSDTTYGFLIKKFSEQIRAASDKRKQLKNAFTKIHKKEMETRKLYVSTRQSLQMLLAEHDIICPQDQMGKIEPSNPKYTKIKSLTDNINKLQDKATSYESLMTNVTMELTQAMKETADQLQEIFRNLLKAFREAVYQFLEINMESTKQIAETLGRLSNIVSMINIDDDLSEFAEAVGHKAGYNESVQEITENDQYSMPAGNSYNDLDYSQQYGTSTDQFQNQEEENTVIFYVTALYNFEKQSEEELSFHVGDRLEVYTDGGNWWKGRNTQTLMTGIFPYNYVERE